MGEKQEFTREIREQLSRFKLAVYIMAYERKGVFTECHDGKPEYFGFEEAE